MNRKENWPLLMQEYLKGVRYNPFAWGTFDCCMFAADCVLAMTGEDAAAPFRGRYTDGPGAVKALREFSGGGLLLPTMEIVAANNGWEPIPNRMRVQRGDVVMGDPIVMGCELGIDGTLGICAGTISLFVGDAGLLGVSTIETPDTPPNITMAWRIKVARD